MSDHLPYSKLPLRDREGVERAIKAIAAAIVEALGLPESQRADIASQIRRQANFIIAPRYYGIDERLIARVRTASGLSSRPR